jgi:uncharacterized membrane protein affecting hemolysin expression
MIHKASVYFMWALLLLVITVGAYGYVYQRVSARSLEASALAQQIKNQDDATAKAMLVQNELSKEQLLSISFPHLM